MRAPEYGTEYFERLKAECLTEGDGVIGSTTLLGNRNEASQSCCGCGEEYCPLSSAKLFFMLHPLADKSRAGDDAEMSTLAACQIHKGVTIQFFEMSQIEQRP